MRFYLVSTLAGTLFSLTLSAQQQNPTATLAKATAVRADVAPVIDGKDDDAVWKKAPAYSDFLEFQPTEGKAPRFKTEFKAAYDDRNLYVFVRAYDPHPDSIMAALTRRDIRGSADQLKIMVDSYHDRRSGFEFAVSPSGVKRDYAMYNDSQEDDTWDGIWDVGTRIDSLGWTAEFKVPFSQLRYANMKDHVFGLGVWRDIERYKERVELADLPHYYRWNFVAVRATRWHQRYPAVPSARSRSFRRDKEQLRCAPGIPPRQHRLGPQPERIRRSGAEIRHHAQPHARCDSESRLRPG